MNLLFKRDQSSATTGKAQFSLWAKTEFDEDEQAIIAKYRFGDAKLIDVPQPGLLRNALIFGVAVNVVGQMLTFSILSRLPYNWLIVLIAGVVAAFLYYDRFRETLRVRDLIHGRYFTCDSVVDLARKEVWLAEVAAVLREVMETAKHWGGTETIPVAPAGIYESRYLALKAL